MSLFTKPPTQLGPLSQLDLSSLQSDEFESETQWLNQLIAAQATASTPQLSTPTQPTDSFSSHTPALGSLAQLDSQLSQTVSVLDSATEDTAALVDRTIDEIARGVPRLTFDLQLMRENALLLKFTLNALTKRSSTPSTSTPTSAPSASPCPTPPDRSAGPAKGKPSLAGVGEPHFGADAEVIKVMERLRILDLVKSRMEGARDVLREAESWSTLDSEVTALVGEQAYAKAAVRLEEAARSMVVFQNTTEYEARRALMVSLQNQLEAALSASLVAAINSRDVKQCKAYFAIFGQIQREPEFTQYYFGSRRAKLVKAWSSANLEDCPEPLTLDGSVHDDEGSTARPVRFTAFLHQFYGELHSLLSEERTYVPAIFPNPTPTLSAFVQTTLEGLSPSLPQRLTAMADTHGPRVLPEIIAAFKATQEFAVAVDQIMTNLRRSTSGSNPLPSPGTPSKTERRLSKRMSISKRMSSRSISLAAGAVPGPGGDGEVRAWETAIFEPFLDWQVEYPELERAYLGSVIAAEEADRDLMAYLTGGGGAESDKGAKALWDHAVGVFGLAEDAISRALALTHGYAAVGLVEVIDAQLVGFMDRRKLELKGVTQGGRRSWAPAVAEDEDELALEGLEYSSQDWTSFQRGLRLLDTCRAISDRLATFQVKLTTRLTVLAQTVKEARADPAGYTIPGTTQGAVTMLRQSGLNSAQLAALLDPLEKPAATEAGAGATVGSPATPGPGPMLLPRARHATTELTRAAQLFLHSAILTPLLTHLDDYAALPAWTTTPDQRPGGKGAFDLAIPTFSLTQSDPISRVGEGLFNLPRLFEVYANDDALAFSIETLPFVDPAVLRAEVGLEAASPVLNLPPPSPSVARAQGGHRLSQSESFGQASPALARRGQSSISLQAPPPAPLPPLSAETVIATWLSSLTLAVLDHLTKKVLPAIARLSRHGAAQLVADLGYSKFPPPFPPFLGRLAVRASPADLFVWRSQSRTWRARWTWRRRRNWRGGWRRASWTRRPSGRVGKRSAPGLTGSCWSAC